MKKLVLILLLPLCMAVVKAQTEPYSLSIKSPMRDISQNYIVNEGLVRQTEVEVHESYDENYDLAIISEWFEGTRVINGTQYHDLHVKYDYKGTSRTFIAAYMREEAGKVYMITADDISVYDLNEISGGAYILHSGKEAMVYDFTLDKSDTIRLFDDDSDYDKYNRSALSANTRTVIDKRQINYSSHDFVEMHMRNNCPFGVDYYVLGKFGGIDNLICFPGIFNMEESPSPLKVYTKVSLYDTSGELIAVYGQQSGVDDVVVSSGLCLEGRTLLMRGANDNSQLVIYNPAGAKVAEAAGISCGKFDLSQLPSGIYIVSAFNGQGWSTLKISL